MCFYFTQLIDFQQQQQKVFNFRERDSLNKYTNPRKYTTYAFIQTKHPKNPEMGILLSILQSIYSYLRGGSSEPDKYKLVAGEEESTRYSERPSTHSACRSSNQHKLITYQSRIDNLKPDQIIYVIKFRKCSFDLLIFCLLNY